MTNIGMTNPSLQEANDFEALPLSILVADDEPRILELLSRHLRILKHRVIGSARNGKEAISLARKLQPDLVILDIAMPLMDGVEAAGEILQDRDMPIIISTGAADEATLRRLRKLNIGAYLVKPFSPAQLKAAIYIAVSQHRHARERLGPEVL